MDAAELVIRITGDIDDIESKLTKTANSAKSMADKIESAGKKMSNAGRSMTTGLTVPIAAIGGLAIKSAIDFESAFTGVRKTIEGSEADFAKLEAGIRQMSKELPASAVEIAKVAETAGQLGVSKENILDFTRTMIGLGESTTMTAEDAATAMARIANITQLPQDQFDELASTLVALGNAGASTEQDIVNMALRIAGAGAQVGLSQAQIMGFAAALADVGIEAEAGGSAISRVFIDISKAVADGGDQLDAFARVAGVSSSEFAKAFKDDAAGAMLAFVNGLGRVKEEGENVFQVIEDLGLGEIRTRDALLRLSGAGEGLARSLGIATSAYEENVAATNEAGQRYATTASQLAIFRNKVTDAAVTLGGAMVPALLKLVDNLEPVGRFLVQAVEWFSNLSPGVQGFILGLVALVAIAGPVLMFLGGIVSAIATLWPVVAAVAGAIFSPIGAIILAVVAIGVAVYALWRNWETIWGWITGAFTAAKDFIVRNFDTILAMFLPFIAALKWVWENWDKIWAAIKDIASRAASWVGDKIGAVIDFLAGLPGRAWNAAASFIDKMWDLAWEAGTKLVNAITEKFDEAVEWAKGLPGRVLDGFGNIGAFLFQAGKDLIMGFINGIKNMASAVAEAAKNVAKAAVNGVKNFLGISSPSKVFMSIGVDTMLGLAGGVEAEARRVMAMLDGVSQDMTAAVSFAPVVAPAPTGAVAGGGMHFDYDRLAAAIVRAQQAAGDKEVHMTFNTPVDPMHVAREVAWSMGG